MIVCAWCHGAIADDGHVAIRHDICEDCLAPVEVRMAESRRRTEARRRAREAEAQEELLAGMPR